MFKLGVYRKKGLGGRIVTIHVAGKEVADEASLAFSVLLNGLGNDCRL